MRLIRGAPGSGRTALIFREFKAALAEGRTDLRILVPTATLVRHFQHELARDAQVISPRMVVSMNRFVRDCAGSQSSAGAEGAWTGDAEGVRSADDLLLRLFVRDALCRADPPEFEGVAATKGMAEVVIESIRLLENAGCDAKKFASVRGLGPHARALGRLWTEIDARLRERGFVSRPELFARAARGAGRFRLWMDGFVTLSPLERRFLRDISDRCEIAVTALDDPSDEVRRWALESGARDQLLSGTTRHPKTVAVEAPTLEREADEIARRIAGLREQGVAWRDIGVAVRDAGTYRPLLETAFERFAIPARFYFARPLASHPAAVFLSGLIDCMVGGWSFEETLAALGAHPGWSASAAFDRFDFKAREAMPDRGSAALLALAEDEWLRQRLETCFAIEAWKSQMRPPAEWARQFQAWAAAVYRPGRVDATGDARELTRLRSHAQGLRAWLDAIEGTLPFWGDAPGGIALGEFWRVAREAVDGASVALPDDRTEAVHVMNALEARQWNLEALFVCGLTDRDYPRRHPRHLLLTAADVEKLAREGIRIRTTNEQDAEERRLFESLSRRAAKWFILTWPRHDPAGRSITESQYAPADRAESLLCAPAGGRERTPSRTAGRIASEALLAELAARHKTISTTHIESLAQCRFRFFAEKTLKLESRPEPPHKRINAREAGLILHETLELWLKDRAGDFAELFEDAFERACAARRLPRGFRLEVERFMLRGVARAVSAEQSWPVEYSEAEVEVTLPLIEIPGATEPVLMTGRVDRVDHVGGSDCVVIDYKARGQASMRRLVESETSLQGPLYALALRRKSGLNTVAMAYWAVRENELHGWGAIPGYTGQSELQPMPPDWETAAWRRIAERLSGFFSGDIAPAPVDEEACRFCDARDCCRVEETRGLVLIEAANG